MWILFPGIYQGTGEDSGHQSVLHIPEVDTDSGVSVHPHSGGKTHIFVGNVSQKYK
jgi:hypothetical protein